MTINLFNTLDDPSPNGTWILLSKPGEVDPGLPATYDADIIFTSSHVYGEYVYQYTVTGCGITDVGTVTINWQEAPDRFNDNCASPSQLLYNQYQISSIEDDNLDRCPVVNAPSKSGSATPPTWVNYNNGTGDLWYTTSVHPLLISGGSAQIRITLSGASFGATGITQPMIAVYTNICDSLQLVYSGVGQNQTITTNTIIVPDTGSVEYTIRVASLTPGNFRLSIVNLVQEAEEFTPII